MVTVHIFAGAKGRPNASFAAVPTSLVQHAFFRSHDIIIAVRCDLRKPEISQ